MSYILDALKKSEQQRQAIQPGSVTDRLLINPPETRPKTRKWWLILILGNLLAIAGMVWYLARLKAPNPDIKPFKSVQSPVPASPVQAANPVSVVQAPAEQGSEIQQPASPSISEMIASEQPQTAAVKADPPLAKPVSDKKAQAAKKRQALTRRNEAYAAARTNDEYADVPAEDQPAPDFAPTSEDPSWTQPVNAAPARPKLAINVFGYTENPKDRFVIINMTKYKAGQRINGDLVLKSIQPDHIVLQQGSVNIKMERP